MNILPVPSYILKELKGLLNSSIWSLETNEN